VIYNPDCFKLAHDAANFIETSSPGDVLSFMNEAQEDVKNNHTYVNRIKNILDVMEIQ